MDHGGRETAGSGAILKTMKQRSLFVPDAIRSARRLLCRALFHGVRRPAVYVITTSGLLHAGTLLLLGLVKDFRMLWWSSVAALLSLPLLRISRVEETSTR